MKFASAAMLRQCRYLLRRLRADTRGAAAIEFALLVPVILALYVGGATVTQIISVDRKVTLAAHSVADLTAQASSVSNNDLSNIIDAASAVMSPYSTKTMSVTITSVVIDKNKKATVLWSKTLNGTQRSGDVTSSIPSDLKEAQSCLVWGESGYAFKPAVGYVITGTINLSDQTFTRPRQATYSDCVKKT